MGVAATKLVAKIGSDLRKPDGLVVVPPGEEAAFLAPLPISRLWGVGEKTAAVLREFGVQTIGDLAALPPDALERRFGKHGAALVERAHGVDADPVATGDPAKSIGHEHTFGHDTADREVIERTLLGMADGVAWRLRAAGLKAATITLKLRDSSFTTITRQTTLDVPDDLTEPIYDAALVLLRRELHGQRIRLVGVTASNFRDREQLAMFGAAEDPKRHQAAEAMDSIRRKYGERAVTRGRLVRAGVPTVFERDPNSAVEGRLGVPDAPTGRRRRRGRARGGDAGEDGRSIRRRTRSLRPGPRGAGRRDPRRVRSRSARGGPSILRIAPRSARRQGSDPEASRPGRPGDRDMQPVTAGRDSSLTTLDIEHLFGLALTGNEQAFASGVPPVDDDPPSEGDHHHGDGSRRTGHRPGPHRLDQRHPA